MEKSLSIILECLVHIFRHRKNASIFLYAIIYKMANIQIYFYLILDTVHLLTSHVDVLLSILTEA
uniref:Uncharacterized protein n=1 Tax=Rhizophora mucronata TaxID=61149 RepID=A0A2P2QJP7_RHIMU